MRDNAPKVYIETYGCQMNVLDSELVRGQLESLGYGFTTQAAEANVVLINTCSVREHSEQKVWSQLGRLGYSKKDERPDLVIGVLGCMAEREGATVFKRMPHVDVVCGPSMLDKLPSLIDGAVRGKSQQVALTGHTTRRSATLEAAQDGIETLDLARAFSDRDHPAQAYVRVTRGCNKFCSFCVVPHTRGPEVHRPPEAIIEEVRRLALGGALEVTLLGQTINHYRHADGGKTTSFAELLARVHDEVPELPRLRFVTSYPRDFTDEALDVMATRPRICRYLHVPAQSGSDRMLLAMNRGYTIDEYLAFIDRARARMPDLRLAGDMIVGFPTETAEEHAASIALLERARYKACFIFKYSPRPGTVAIRRFEDDIPEEVKRARNQELLEVQSKIAHAHLVSLVGEQLEVLVEGVTKLRRASAPVVTGAAALASVPAPEGWTRLVARTRGDEIVAFDGPAELVGKLTQVEAVGATPLTVLARWSAS